MANEEKETAGKLAARALVVTAGRKKEGSLSPVVKTAYQNLKDKIAPWAAQEVNELEKDPTRVSLQNAIEQKITNAINQKNMPGSPDDKEIRTLVSDWTGQFLKGSA